MSSFLFADNYESLQNATNKKQQLEKAQETFKNNYVTTGVYDRTKSIYQAYHILPPGIIASLSATGADNDAVKDLAQQVYKTAAKQDTDYARVPQSFISNVKEAGKKTLSPFMKAINLGFSIFEHSTTHQAASQMRANIQLAGDIEEIFEKGFEINEDRFASQKAKLIGAATSFAVAPSLINRRNNATSNAITELLANKLFGKDINLRSQPFQNQITQYRQDAGPSSFEYTFQELSKKEGLDPSSPFRNVPELYKRIGLEGINEFYEEYNGKGFLPLGKAFEESEKIKTTSLQYDEQSITTGKYISNLLGVDTDENKVNVLSGTIDAAFVAVTDPFLVANKARQAFKALKLPDNINKLSSRGKQVSNNVQKLLKEGNTKEANALIERFTKSPDMEATLRTIVADDSPNKFVRLFDATKDADFATKMTEAKNYRQAKTVFQRSMKTGPDSSASKLGNTKVINDWLSDPQYKTFWNYISKNAKKNNVYGVFGSGRVLPTQTRNLEDIDGVVKDMIGYGAAAKLDSKVINDLTFKVASLINKGNLGEAKIVFHEEYYKAIADNLDEFKANKEVKQAFMDYQTSFRGFVTDGVRYTIDQTAFRKERAIKPIQTKLAQTQHILGDPVPTDIAFPHQLTDLTVDFINIRQLRNQASTVGKILNNKLDTGFKGKINGDTIVGQILTKSGIAENEMFKTIPELYWSTGEFLWATQKVWTRLQLVTRIAYPLRLIAEGQPRMWLYGLDALPNNPLSYLSYFLSMPKSLSSKLAKVGFKVLDEDVMGDKFIKGLRRSKMTSHEAIEKATGNYQNKLYGPSNKNAYMKENYVTLTLTDELMEDSRTVQKFADAIQIQYNNLAKEDLAKGISEALANGKPLDGVKDAYWKGDLQDVRLSQIKLYEPGNVNKTLLATKEGSDDLIDSYAKYINETVGYDNKLLQGIATGKLDDVNLLTWDRFETGARQKISENIKNMLRTSENRPGIIGAPDYLAKKTADEFLERQKRGGSFLWYYLGQLPESRLNRIPSFKQFYYRRIKEILPQIDAAGQKKLLARMDKLPNELVQDLKNVKSIKGGGFKKYTLEEASQDAMEYSLNQHNKILYNLSEKGLVADSLRFMFPFFEAYKEVALSWGKGFAQKSYSTVRQFSNISQAGRKQGIFYKDFRTGEDYFVYPQSEAVSRILVPGESEDRNVDSAFVAPLAGFNLISTSLLPGVGPVVGISAGILKNLTSFDNDELARIFFPFGLPVEDIGQLGTGETFIRTFLPAYMTKAITALTNQELDGFNSEYFAAQMNESIRVLALSENQPLETIEQFKKFQEKAYKLTRDRILLRSFAQFMAPAAPRIIYQQAFTPENAEELLEAVLDTDKLGKLDVKDRKTMVQIGVLAAYYSNLEREAGKLYGDEGEEIAFYTFVRNLGLDKNSLEDLLAATTLTKGKYKSRGAKEPQFVGEVKFTKEYPGILEKYPLTGVYLTPNIQDEKTFDEIEFFNLLDKLQAIDPAIFLVESQKYLYSLIKRNLVEPLDGDYSLEANLIRDKAKIELNQMLPFGDPYVRENLSVILDRNILQPYSTDINANILELENMSKDVALKDVTPVWSAINQYMEARNMVLKLISEDAGRVPEDSREYAKGRLRNADKEVAQFGREILRDYAKILSTEVPEFLVLYDDLLRKEIQYNREE